MRDNREALWAVIDSRDMTLAALRRELVEAESQLAEKEAALLTLHDELDARARVIEEMRAAHAESHALAQELERKQKLTEEMRAAHTQSHALAEELEGKRKLIEEVRAAYTQSPALARELEAKQKVIEELSRALRAYRAAFAVFGAVTRPAGRFVAFATRPIRLFVPRLGVLCQHPPIGLRRPPAYSCRASAPRPRISIVTPSFRQAAYIDRTIRSVLDQRYPNLEYFVQDGASDDGTREILERYADRLAGWESRPDTGQSEAINRGFARTSGEIMAWLNSDDILFPGALDCVADYFERHPEVDVVYGHRVLIDEDDREIGRWVMPAHDDRILSWADYVPQETLFWRRRIWQRAGGKVDESFRFAMDWDLLVRFRDAGARFARIPRFLGGFRVHSRQKTSAGISSVGFQEMDRIRSRVLGRVPDRLELRKALAPYLLRHVAADLAWRVRFRLGVA